jgi:hypothetical protein
MAEEKPARIVRVPTDEEAKAAFEAYTLAVGKVAFAWNFLHERLGRLFVAIAGADRNIALGAWYSTKSDRAQRGMLEGAINGSPDNRWPSGAKADLLSVMRRANELGNRRNDAVHAPCLLATDVEGTEMTAAFFSGHPLANNLRGKNLLIEFDWLERAIEDLSRFTEQAETALNFAERYSWPEIPRLPDRRPKRALIPLIPRT